MNKLLGPLMGLALVGLIIFFATTDSSSVDTTSFFTDGDVTKIQDKDFKVGTGEVEIIEYGDFECPACGAFFPTATRIKEELTDDVTFAFRHLPLTAIHPRAMAAHRASEAAALQDKFFEMHDILYENQTEWGTRNTANLTDALNIIEGYAEDIGLDMEQYRADVQSQVVLDNIKIHTESAQEIGATSTPSIYVNGEKIRFFSGFSFDDMVRIVENAKAGRPLEEVQIDAEELGSSEETGTAETDGKEEEETSVENEAEDAEATN